MKGYSFNIISQLNLKTMSQNNDGLNFTMSYNEVLNLSFEKEVLLTRDQTDLASRGITVARITAFAGLRNTFMAVPTDDTMKANISIAINARDVVANQMRVAIREVLGIAKNTFGDGTAQYKTFNGSEISRLDATALSFLSVTIVTQGNTYLAQMTPKGLTAAMLTAITTLKVTLDLRIKDVDTANAAQLTTTQTRHIAANALFDEMSAMCDAAQVYYADRNPLKASQYIIYDTVGSEQQRNGIVAAKSTVYRGFDELTADAAFKLKVIDGNDLVFYFSQTEGGDAGAKTVTISVDPNNYTETTAADLGYNSSTGFIKFNIKNNGSVESVYRVVME